VKILLLCADDFGLTPAIDRGILALAAQRRLSAVSCIVNAPGWAADAAALLATGVRCGLHLNLTEGRALSPALAAHWPVLPGLPRLLALAHVGRLPQQAMADELDLQLAAFERAAGQPPDHLDGHQHVHHLPGVRQAVLALLAQRPGLQVRHTGKVLAPGWRLKGRLIAGTGGRALGRQLLALGRAQNQHLLGVHDFADRPFRTLMQAWLASLPPTGGLVFCHPAAPALPGEPQAADPIAHSRRREFAYLASSDFANDLAAAGVSLQTSSGGSS
jgi:predicted glycoside hydrolase/deacetylase ChbG (UPF0249 family)